MDVISQYLEVTTFIITILGFPAAIFIYLTEQRTLRTEREYGTFDTLDEKYIEIQQLCLEHPELDIFDTPYDSPRQLTEEQKKQEEAILLIRISIFERAFLMYQQTTSQSKKDQWAGWEVEIEEWFSRENFKATWSEHGPYFDKSFYDHFNHNMTNITQNNQEQPEIVRIG